MENAEKTEQQDVGQFFANIEVGEEATPRPGEIVFETPWKIYRSRVGFPFYMIMDRESGKVEFKRYDSLENKTN